MTKVRNGFVVEGKIDHVQVRRLETRIVGDLRVFVCADSTNAEGYIVEQFPEGVCVTNANLD